MKQKTEILKTEKLKAHRPCVKSGPRRLITFPLVQIKLAALNRPAGYLDECLCRGKLSADESMLGFTPAAFIDIRNRFPETIKTRA